MQPNRNMTLKTFMESYFLPSKSADWGDDTMRQNRGQICLYILPLLGMCRLGTIGRNALEAFFDSIAAKYSLSILKNLYYILGGAMRLAKKSGAISVDPTLRLKLPNVNVERGAVPTREQVVRLLSATKNVQDKCMLMLVVFCRLLGNQLLGLRWGDLRGEYLEVREGAPLILLPGTVQGAITAWRGQCPDSAPDAFMFVSRKGQPFARPIDFERRHISPVAERLEIPQHLITFQALRRAVVPLKLSSELNAEHKSVPKPKCPRVGRTNHQFTQKELTCKQKIVK